MPDQADAALQTGDTQQTNTTDTIATTAATAASSAATVDQSTAVAKSVWPENWRQQMVGSDEKELKQAERYLTPGDVWKKARELERKLSSGEVRKTLPADAKPEEITAWRKENGIPEQPDGYLANLPNGLVIGEDDKEIFGSFASALHGVNADPKIAHTAIAWYNQFQEQQLVKLNEADVDNKTKLEDQLHTEWGADYRANVNSMKTLLAQAPKEVGEAIVSARLPDGRRIIDTPHMATWLAGLSREINPVATLLPSGNGSQQSMDTRISEIEKMMRDNRAAYNKNERVQEEYRKLITAREKMKERAA